MIQPASQEKGKFDFRHHTRRSRNGIVPLGSCFKIAMLILGSVLFISTICLAFVAPQSHSNFKKVLNEVAAQNSGIVLVGESVDVDINEPAVTIRWSLVACGADYVLPQSQDIHGSSSCGLPSMAISVFVDDAVTSLADYTPSENPIDSSTGKFLNIQNLFQFDSAHVLDVHNDRLYPFDSYVLTSNIRIASSNDSSSLPLLRLPVVSLMTSFSIDTSDTATTVTVQNSTQQSRMVQMKITRPSSAKAYVMLLFCVNWFLAHCSIGMVILTFLQGYRNLSGVVDTKLYHTQSNKNVLKRAAGILAILLVIPQLRGAMPDSPGLDGVLVDEIGYFPQMIFSGLSAVFLLVILVKREFDRDGDESNHPEKCPAPSLTTTATSPSDPDAQSEKPDQQQPVLTPLRKAHSSMDIKHFRRISLTSAELMKNAGANSSLLRPGAERFDGEAMGHGREGSLNDVVLDLPSLSFESGYNSRHTHTKLPSASTLHVPGASVDIGNINHVWVKGARPPRSITGRAMDNVPLNEEPVKEEEEVNRYSTSSWISNMGQGVSSMKWFDRS